MKILILSCFTGEGHNSAAYAIEEAMLRNGIECEVADPVAFAGERAQHFVSGFYNNMIKKIPGAFGALYHAGNAYSATGVTSPIYLANAMYAQRLNEYLVEQGFNGVISTHLYGMEVMTAIHNRMKSTIPSYGVMTDYTCVPFFRETVLDGYFVPNAEVKEKLIQTGIPGERVIITGIPVSAKFKEPVSKQEARDSLSIPQDKIIYLIMTGGIGCENMQGLCDRLLRSGKNDFVAYVLVGRNEELKEALTSRYGTDGQIRAVSFTKQVHLYMKAADVMISKPGGLSSTEAAVANVPLVHFKAIPGCETQNAIFFSAHGLSLWAKTETEAVASMETLAHDGEMAERMRSNQRLTINADAAEDIVRYVTSP